MVHVAVADFEERSCPPTGGNGNAKRELTEGKSTQVNPQLAYHRTPPCNMYCVSGCCFLCIIVHLYCIKKNIL